MKVTWWGFVELFDSFSFGSNPTEARCRGRWPIPSSLRLRASDVSSAWRRTSSCRTRCRCDRAGRRSTFRRSTFRPSVRTIRRPSGRRPLISFCSICSSEITNLVNLVQTKLILHFFEVLKQFLEYHTPKQVLRSTILSSTIEEWVVFRPCFCTCHWSKLK